MNISNEIDFSNKEILLTRQNTLRILVGILGIALPILLYVFLYVDLQYKFPLESISHYYFTRVAGIFTITLSLLAIFLIIYKGKGVADFVLSTTAGLFALVVVLFPKSNINPMSPDCVCSVTTLNTNKFRIALHYISAAIFLLSLAAMACLYLQNQTNHPNAGPRKKKSEMFVFAFAAL